MNPLIVCNGLLKRHASRRHTDARPCLQVDTLTAQRKAFEQSASINPWLIDCETGRMTQRPAPCARLALTTAKLPFNHEPLCITDMRNSATRMQPRQACALPVQGISLNLHGSVRLPLSQQAWLKRKKCTPAVSPPLNSCDYYDDYTPNSQQALAVLSIPILPHLLHSACTPFPIPRSTHVSA